MESELKLKSKQINEIKNSILSTHDFMKINCHLKK